MATPVERAQQDYDRAVLLADKAEKQAAELRSRIGPAREALDAAKRNAAEAIPVDRSARVLTDGSPVPGDNSHTEATASGQQKGYVVLTEAERSKGFVRPVRNSYVHERCGSVTTMGRSLAETYARYPFFYSGTFCCACGRHFPVGASGEFVWRDTEEKVGT